MNQNKKRKHASMSTYKIHKHWDKSRKTTLNQEEVEWRLYNNLPVDDLYDNLKQKYSKENKGSWKHENGYNLNSQNKKKRDDKNMP